MEVGRRQSMDYAEMYGKKILKINEFTPIKGKTTGNEAIKEFLKQKNVAAWFRGTSHIHIQAADRLFNALRDDGEQKTTHRVSTCLNLIGLKPMIASKQIKFLMHLSRGNDLVFLWFLMEMHYKTPKQRDPNSYSINEQLICSAICHLDMIPTLRELDKIIPRGHMSRIEMKKAGLKRLDTRIKESFMEPKSKRVSHDLVLPYFKKYCRLEHYGEELYLKEPNFKVNLNLYNMNQNVQNESNRWYADYRFNPSKRIVHSIIREILANIFYDFAKVTLQLKDIDILCNYHKAFKLEHELKVAACKNDCLKYGIQWKLSRDRNNANKIKDQLNNAIRQELRKFNQKKKAIRQNESLKVISSEFKMLDVILGNDNKKSEESSNTAKLKTNNIIKDSAITCKTTCATNCCRNTRTKHTRKFNTINQMQIKHHCCNVSDTVGTRCDEFFKRPTDHKPFKFEYKKIFVPKSQDDEKNRIRKMFLAALNEEDISTLSTESLQSNFLYDEAIKKYTKTTFDTEVRKYEADKIDEIKTKANDMQTLNSIDQCHHPPPPPPPFPASPLTKYNAKNYYYLMEQMLSEAFQYLRKNPKFVWAQLPDAHKVPFLREWISRRFGKEYTPIEKIKSYERSSMIFRALEKINVKLHHPNANRMGKHLFLDYNCRQHVEQKVQHVRRKYYRRLDSSFLKHTRIFWFAMRGYICSKGPPRKSFFAYMPSRIHDIHHFRLWKSSEHRNYKIANAHNDKIKFQ